MSIHIALDAMGGDFGPSVIVPAALHMLGREPELKLTLVGDEATLGRVLGDSGSVFGERLHIRHASETVDMDEAPSQALRRKKDSSMRVAIDLVKSAEADACVSAGNTGALMAIARFVLKTLPGIDRPAICSIMPGIEGSTHMLDLGANVDSSAEQLFQFAVMGSVLSSAAKPDSKRRVALLNIGAEEMKGNEQVKQAAALLEHSNLNYVGYVEGDDIYKGVVDVIVCDGFVGNVALKASEGVAKMITHFAREEFSRSFFSKIAALITMRVLNTLRKRTDPRRYNGASLLGLRGIVVKSHGGADKLAFATAITEAMVESRNRVPEKISAELGKLLQTSAKEIA